MTNYGNGYKFEAMMKRRTNNDSVMVQRLLKSGKWGKPSEAKRYGTETDDEIVARLMKNNPGDTYRLAE